MVAAVRGTIHDIRPTDECAITIPGYNADGWGVGIFSESGFLDPDKPIRKYTRKERQGFLHKEPTKVKVGGVIRQSANVWFAASPRWLPDRLLWIAMPIFAT